MLPDELGQYILQVATVGGMSDEAQMTENGSAADYSMDAKQQQQTGQQQQGFPSSAFASAIPITAQAGVIDGMED